MSSLNFIKDHSTGETFIPATQRPDGTWRKPIKVKDGYTPQEEQPVYVPKGRAVVESRPYPVGLSAQDLTSSTNTSTNRVGKKSSMFFEVGNYEPETVIPGLNYTSPPATADNNAGFTAVKSSKKKKKNSGNVQVESVAASAVISSGGVINLQTQQQQQLLLLQQQLSLNENNVVKKQSKEMSRPQQQQQSMPVPGQGQTDPAKRLRNLRKRLKDIEALESKIGTGELKNPDKDQLEKVKRKEEVEDEIDELEKFLQRLNCS